MIEGSQKGKILTRAQALVNITLMVILAFYICHSLAAAYMNVSDEPDVCWLSWLIIALCSFVLFTLQLTTDLFLFKNMKDTIQGIRQCEQWLRMSVLFISVLVFGLLFTLICDVSRSWSSPALFFILIISEVICRAGGLYFVRNYLLELRKSIERDSILFIPTVASPTPSLSTTTTSRIV